MVYRPDDAEHEYPLTGGNVAASVVRVGVTVRKPITAATADVEAYLLHLERQGFRHAPRFLGRDGKGRQVLDYIEGETITEPELLSLDELGQIGAIVHELHDVSASFAVAPASAWDVLCPAPSEELICHNDLGPWNLVRTPAGWAFIDWDGSGPSTRMWDLAYAAQSIVALTAGGEPQHDALRLRHFLKAYRLDASERTGFAQILLDRTRFGYDFLKSAVDAGREPWARLFAEGHGEYWHESAAYIERNMQVWNAAIG